MTYKRFMLKAIGAPSYDSLEIKGEFDPPTDKGTELVLQVFPDLKATITQQSRIVQTPYFLRGKCNAGSKNLQYTTIKTKAPIFRKRGGAPTVYISVNTEYSKNSTIIQPR
ncbi:hypothetical protein MASR1M31_10830 [Porphyromonadaceae bacterium]